MKKFITFFTMCLLMAQAASAQYFNHLAVGIGAGTDGFTAELAAPVGDHFQVRAGYGFASFDAGIQVGETSVPAEPCDDYKDAPHVAVPLYACPAINTGRLLVNWFPAAEGVFSLCAGVFAGGRDYVDIKGTGLPDAYNDVGYRIDGYVIKAVDNVGRAQIRQNAVKPYLGIGFGRPVGDNTCSFTLDLGVQYLGAPSLWLHGYKDGTADQAGWTQVERADIDEEFAHYYDEVCKYARFWPTISLRVWFKTF